MLVKQNDALDTMVKMKSNRAVVTVAWSNKLPIITPVIPIFFFVVLIFMSILSDFTTLNHQTDNNIDNLFEYINTICIFYDIEKEEKKNGIISTNIKCFQREKKYTTFY